MTDDSNLARLQRGESRSGGFREFQKRNILLLIILAVLAGVFFSTLGSGKDAYAQKPALDQPPQSETIDPMTKIGKSSLPLESDELCREKTGIIERNSLFRKITQKKEKTADLKNMLAGYPIEKMIPYITQEDKTVAAFLISIARKESTWGKHSPQKDGHTCYNYWGYRGSYNLTASGYSCFDSPAQAVAVVGGRINQLVNQNLNTPAKMVVWKCGGDCRSDSGASGWIAAVSQYFYKLDS